MFTTTTQTQMKKEALKRDVQCEKTNEANKLASAVFVSSYISGKVASKLNNFFYEEFSNRLLKIYGD